MNEYAIETKNLKISYGDNEVIKGVDLKVLKNVVFALMGPSGCGKSTMLRAFNRLLELNKDAVVEGEVLLFGENIYSPDIDPIEVRRDVGMVFQYPNPFPHLTIYYNVAIGLKLNKLAKNKRELDERVRWALEKAALWDEVKDRLNESALGLSGGQQQRLCIARALAVEPEILLMDEPASALDPIATQKIEELITMLSSKLTIIIVTHNMQQAARVSNKTAFFYMGKLIEINDTKTLFTKPELKQTEDYITGRFG